MKTRLQFPLIFSAMAAACLACLVPAWSAAEVPVSAPLFTINIAVPNISVKPGVAARITAKATGGVQPIKYQWYFSFNGTGNLTALTNNRYITGANTPSLSIGGTNATDIGVYNVIATDSTNATATSNNATLSFTGVPPANVSIKSSPANLTLAVGKSVTFTATALTGTPKPSFQWLMNGANITGQTRTTYSIAKVTTEMNGAEFSVLAINPLGNVTSAAKTVTVTGGVGPTITTQPADQTVASNSTAKFSVVVAGSPTLLYQWFFGATPLVNTKEITGATTAKLTISKVSDDDVGNYSVMVSNGVSTVTSDTANLTLSE